MNTENKNILLHDLHATMEEVSFSTDRDISPIDKIMDIAQKLMDDIAYAGDSRVQLAKLLNRLDDMERQEFILMNMLEALKKGDDYQDIKKRYEKLGLIQKSSIQSRNEEVNREDKENSDIFKTNQNDSKANPNKNSVEDEMSIGEKIWRFLNWPYKKIKNCIITAITNVLQSIPDYITVQPIIGLNGIIPTLQLKFDLKEISVKEIYDILIKAKAE